MISIIFVALNEEAYIGETLRSLKSKLTFPHEIIVSDGNSQDRTVEIARKAGLLRRDWQKKGQTLSYTDVTIAAVALSNKVPLLTDNRKHFPMPELKLIPLPNRAG